MLPMRESCLLLLLSCILCGRASASVLKLQQRLASTPLPAETRLIRVIPLNEVPEDCIALKTLVWSYRQPSEGNKGDLHNRDDKKEDKGELASVITVLALDASVNFTALASILNTNEEGLQLAPREVAETLTGYSIGTIPPIGHTHSLPIYLDGALFLRNNEIREEGKWEERLVCGGGGHPDHRLVLTLQDLVTMSSPPLTIANFSNAVKSTEGKGVSLNLMQSRVSSPSSMRVTASVLRALSTSSKSLEPVILAVLRDKGNIDEVNPKSGFNALHYASQGGTPFNVRAILQAGADINSVVVKEKEEEEGGDDLRGFTPLMLAVKAGRSAVVLCLLDAGADVSLRARNGATALSFATRQTLSVEAWDALMTAAGASSLSMSQSSSTMFPSSLHVPKEIEPLDPANAEEVDRRGGKEKELVEIEGMIVSRRQLSKSLLFGNLVPLDSPPPQHPLDWFAWEKRSSEEDLEEKASITTTACALQFIVGKTVRVRLGQEASIALCRQLRVGLKVRLTGWLRNSLEEANVDLVVAEVLFFNESRPLNSASSVFSLPTAAPHTISSPAVIDTVNKALNNKILPSSSLNALTPEEVRRLCGGKVDHRSPPPVSLIFDKESISQMASYFVNKLDETEEKLIVGLDCEWRPERSVGAQHKVSLLQLSDGRCSFLIDLQTILSFNHSDMISSIALINALNDTLSRLFRSSQVVVVGFGVSTDLLRLAASYPELSAFHRFGSVLDLLSITKSLFSKARSPSYSAVCRLLTGRHIDKAMQISRWDERPLTLQQLNYAAVDAAASVLMLKTWLKSPQYNPKRLSLDKVTLDVTFFIFRCIDHHFFF